MKDVIVNRDNPILRTDSYKASHWRQYPEGTTAMQSYIESRGGAHNEHVFFGLQAYIKDFLSTPIKREDVDIAENFIARHMEYVDESKLTEDRIKYYIDALKVTEWKKELGWDMKGNFRWLEIPVKTEPIKLPIYDFTGLKVNEIFNREGFDYIVDRYNGYWPVTIKAVPEGSVVPTHNCLVNVECHDPKCFWVVSYLETSILSAVWYPTTVATISWRIKQIIKEYLDKTSDIPDIILPTRLHDFGFRGVSSFESALLGGMAHLVNFAGTDTIAAIIGAMENYDSGMCAFSIAAAEHSTMTALGPDGEWKQMERMVDAFARPGAFVACVSDSYNIYKACSEIWGKKLKKKVIDSGAIIIVRPDSGDPEKVSVEVVQELDKQFGHTVNMKGYKVLNNVRVIYGDGVNEDMIRNVLAELERLGYSAENIAFGMGGALLQRLDRDTGKWAMKCCWMKINGESVDIYKEPITDPGKNSKRGRLTLVQWNNDGHFDTVLENLLIGNGNKFKEALVTVYENGNLVKEYTFDEIRERSNKIYHELKWC